ncbi:MAG TPA: DUF4349 domain-containing protein [Acidimicrobiales bacterium]|nr:DUF4349 domain-containing protein [Acidimicrobiales bacterium]
MGIAALVLGGVAVAASGAFDSTQGRSTAADASTGVADAGATPTTMVGLPTGAKLETASVGGAATIAANAAPDPAFATGGGDVAQAPTPPAALDAGPKIVKTADLTVSIAKGKFTGAFAAASRIATANGGFVVSSSTSTDGFVPGPIPLDDASAQPGPQTQAQSDSRARAGQLTIRVPADKFDSTRAALSGLGDVENETINGQDVTAQLVDMNARITSLKAEEAAFQTLLGKATAIGDVLQIQDQLFNVRTQIEELQAQQANLDDQATFSTITVSMYEPGVVFTPTPEREPSILAKAWDDAAGGALNVLGGMVVVLGYAVPLGALVLLGVGIWSITAPWRRRRRSAEQQLAVEP